MGSAENATAAARPEYVEHLGVKIAVPAAAVSDTVLKFMQEGRYESREGKILNKIIEDGERILELGGGLGFISTIAAKNQKTKAVRTYEANPALKDVIAQTHKLNGVKNVEVETAVLVREARVEHVPFYVRKDFWGSSLAKRVGETTAKEVMVPVKELSWVLGEFRPTMIVCDIEGGEADLFDGRSLPGVTKVLVEVHQPMIGPKGMQSVFDGFSRSGFFYDQDFSSGGVILFRKI
ncbi:FkbM family methyltransferase [Sinorhizobium meliloti]|uniref:FkbM family methyltransferase n=1 Tax=Rhizobium meliloti TaxID=382 RepID=UPI0001E4BC2B|nr:FkbM family methyltransferase [Sinorhizobium meliloti]AEG08389.1 methyltransferase FkbM family [Sinorhizobium meliloti BL225C]MCO6426225.1 FkbM family methyltransferase [Sinorhizobium meliloti]MDE4549380.1 FkbM family methyltransferase [Sinorhizobium meliloti]MDE4569669.1 FkbM family methyltransferase [Sinorhizobium meliloti]MDW9401420.1 FkbM family methyltransferase [Sinorhizobium meliloti]